MVDAITILIVEDNLADFELSKTYINKSSLEVAEFYMIKKLENTLEFLEAQTADIILYDLSLPDANGIDGFRRLKEQTTIPIIVLTGRDDQELALDLVATGAQEYIIKNDLSPKILERSIQYAIERSKLQYQANQSQRRFQIIFETSPLAIIFIDSDSYIKMVNPKFTELLGYNEEEIVGRSVFSITYEPDVKKSKLLFNNLLDDPDMTYSVEKRYISKSGVEKWVHVTLFTIEEYSDEEFLIIDFVRDITEAKLSEQRLEEQGHELQLARKMETFGLLAGGIAHDYNNILTTISGYTQLASMHLDDLESSKNYLKLITEAVSKATKLTKSLMMTAGKHDENKTKNSLNQIVESIKSMISKVGSHIEISLNLTNDETTVYGNTSQLENAILNLVFNAKDAIDETGKISITTSVINCKEMPFESTVMEDEYVYLAVKDDGTGISDDILDSIFDPFYTTKPQGEGTGLGLTNIKRIVEDHDGFISVDSEVGEGSIFRIYLPVYQTNSIYTLSEAASHEAFNFINLVDENILLVEDNEGVSMVIKENLQKCGANVIAAKNGEEALDYILNMDININLIITDLQMPKLTGIQLVNLVNSYNDEIPIIIISGAGKKITNKIKLDIPILRKPFKINELFQIIGDYIGKTNSDNS